MTRIGHDERGFRWMSEKRAQQWVRDNKKKKPDWPSMSASRCSPSA
jgi:hypothetical protein